MFLLKIRELKEFHFFVEFEFNFFREIEGKMAENEFHFFSVNTCYSPYIRVCFPVQIAWNRM